jgi:PhnB protein
LTQRKDNTMINHDQRWSLPRGNTPVPSRWQATNTYPDGTVVVELAVEGARFRVADEAPEASNLSPQTLNGTTVRINLLVADPDQLAARAIANGATKVAPVADQSYGLRPGRFADPFGHHWLIGRPLAGEGGAWARRPGASAWRQADSPMRRNADA